MKKLLFCALFFLSASASAQFLVGNGGQGVLLENRIVVRDLYERGTDSGPYFGAEIAPAVRERLRGSPAGRVMGGDVDLLLRKLTDFYRLWPMLGLAVTQSVGHFSIQVAGERLRPLPQDPDHDLPVVQLAVRQKNHLILSPDWRRLDGAQRAALLIHEGLYTLLKVDCDPLACDQYSIYVRDLVGDAFSKARLASASYLNLLERRLDLPLRTRTCGVRPTFEVTANGRTVTESFRSFAELETTLRAKVCSKLAEPTDLLLSLKVPSWLLMQNPYEAPGRPQSGLSVVSRPQKLKFSWPVRPADCAASVKSLVTTATKQAERSATFVFEDVCVAAR